MRTVTVKDTGAPQIKILLYFFFLLTFVFVLRLFTIQVLGHKKYQAMAQEQYMSFQDIPATRGTIYSADHFPLAATELSYLLYVEPKKIENIDYAVSTLMELLTKGQVISNDERSAFEDKLRKLVSKDLYWVAVVHNLTPFQKEILEKAELDYIGFEDEPVRFYPEATLASHVLGFVASDAEGSVKGYFGIEGSMDGDLKGKAGKVIEEKDALGNPILLGGYKRVDPINGRNVILTIDRSVQHLVERKLEEGVKEYGAVSGSIIVMEPSTGNVIALANYPTYHPGEFDDFLVDESSQEYSYERRNLSIAETYEPGSVIKALTVAAGIDLNKITPDSTYTDSGPVEYSGYVIDNWDGKHHGVMNITQLLQKSNNIGSAWVGHLVGQKNLYKYFSAFGLGQISGISLEGEDTGIVRNYKDWTDIDLATAAFGQGISTTPLQVLNAFNVIANGGVLMQPRIVDKIVDASKTIEMPVKQVRRVLSEETANTVSSMLVEAVEGGESKFYNIKDYVIAGKTGTAQIPLNGKYDPNKTNATFVGYLGKSKKFSMIVRLDRPSSSVYAAETAVPLWMSVASDLVSLFGIPPDKH